MSFKPRYSIIPNQPSGYPLASGTTGFWSVVKPDNTVINLNSYGLLITGYQGGGQNPFNTVRSSLGLSGGSFYQRTVDTERSITLVCVLQNASFYRLQNIRQQIINLLTHDSLTQTAQSLKLRFQQVNNCGVATGVLLECPVVFSGGMGGDVSGLFQDRFALQFLELTPPSIVETGTNTITFGGAQTLPSAGVLQRNSSGVWSSFGGFSNAFTFAEKINGDYLIGTGLSVSDSILGTTAANSSVLAVGFDTAGNRYAGGSFTTPQTRFMRNLGAGWVSAAGSTWNGDVNSLTQIFDGNIFIGGAFTVPFNYFGVYNTGANTAAVAPCAPNGLVRCCKKGPDGYYYIGGDFTNATSATGCNRILKVDYLGATVATFSTGHNGSVYDIAFKRNGNMIAVGSFTTSGGITTNGVAEWDGYSWKAVGSRLAGTVPKVAVDAQDRIHVIDLTRSDYLIWNGVIWTHGDIIGNFGSPLIYTRNNGNILIAPTNTRVANLASVNYTGTAAGYLTFSLSPSAVGASGFPFLSQIVNYTTGKILYFDRRLPTVIGETLTIVISPAGITYTSSVRGNILSEILPGSDLATFGLKANTTNVLGLFLYDATAGTFQATYQNTHNSFDASAA